MIGKNELHLNTATMIKIVQEWLDRELQTPNGIVKDVRAEGGKYDGPTFVVRVESPCSPVASE